MEKYFSCFTAATMWNIPFIEVILGKEFVQTGTPQITVSKHNARFRNNGKLVHSCDLALPAYAIVTRNQKTVASPELLFLELANKISIHQLILLGLQLCSHPPGLSSIAITTKQKLSTFLSETLGHRGHRKALRALKYVENGSASIMESLVYMILTLPHTLGGYGLKGAIFNQEIRLKNEMRTCLGQERCFTDLYYKQVKLAVEYESFAYHSSPAEQGRDVLRAAVLERQGVQVMHLSTIQLYDRDACKVFARNLAARLGKRIQINAKGFDEMHTQIRALLPERNSVI